jgi:TolB-like protein/tetratricopeptide (TPR) repeat protein
MSFFNELKRRNVIRMVLLYAVAGWVVLQIADVLFDPLGLPEWTFRLVLGLLLLGFPFALIFAWVFEMTPQGLRRERDIDPATSIVAHTGRKMNILIVGLLVVAIAGLVIDRLIPEHGATIPTAPDAAGSGEPADVPPAESTISNQSIAVLPFVNMSGDAENEYFSDGLSEELLNALVRFGGLKVTGRTSSFAFKGQRLDMREIGRRLNVANVLEGSVRKAGNRVRITAQLVKTSDGYHLWSDTFDRELDDIFAIQQEIADHVADALHATLLGGPPVNEPVVTSGRRDAGAYEEYLRGRYIWQRDPDSRESLDRAQSHFEQALLIDPQYADALWGIFQVWDRMNRNGHVPFSDSLEEMQRYAAELEQRAPGSDRALMASARIATVRYEYARSEAYLEQAAERYPGSADVWGEYAAILNNQRKYDRAIDAINLAAQLDPLSLEVMRWKAFILQRMRDCDGLEQVMQRALEMEPDAGRFRYYLAMCIYETTGDTARALPLAETEPLRFAYYTGLAILYDAQGDRQRAQEHVDQMLTAYGDAASYQYGQIYTQWGEYETALVWLANALEIRDPGIIQSADDPLLYPLRDDPRFQQILRKAGHDLD